MKSKLSYSLRACVLLFSLLTINTLFAQNAIQKKTISVALVNQQDQMQTNANSQIIKIQEEVALSNVNDLLQTTYELSSTDNLVQTSSKLDAIGYSHYKYQQEYKGLIVEWSTVTVHSKQGIIKNISGNYRKISELNIDPDLSSAQGLQMALNQVNAEKYIWDENPEINPPNGDLVVFTHPHSGTNHLAYKYDVYSFEPLYRAFVYVDAIMVKFSLKIIEYTIVRLLLLEPVFITIMFLLPQILLDQMIIECVNPLPRPTVLTT